jgi:hypothetical protein
LHPADVSRNWRGTRNYVKESTMLVRKIALALAMTTASLTAAYAFVDVPPAAVEAASTASMPADCGNQMARHDHGAEKGMPTPKSARCQIAKDASAGASTPTKKVTPKGHDHNKFHNKT